MVRTLTICGLVVLAGAFGCGSDKGNTATGGSGGDGGSVGTGGSSATGGKTGTGGSGTGGATATGGATGTGGSGTGGATGTGGSTPDASAGDAGSTSGDAAAGGSGGGTGASKMTFFMTSEKSTTGNLGGLAMADAKCARLAAAAGATAKTWKAYLSTATENARTRIGAGPWFNFKGEMVAANLMQLHEEGGMKNNLTQMTSLTDTGKIVSGRTVKNPGEGNEHDVLTGSLRSGMVKPNAHCNNWTATTGSSGVGHSDRMGVQADPVVAGSWNDAHEGQCGDTAPGGGAGRFYCFATD
jgi:hypothetical protein